MLAVISCTYSQRHAITCLNIRESFPELLLLRRGDSELDWTAFSLLEVLCTQYIITTSTYTYIKESIGKVLRDEFLPGSS